MCVHTRAKFHHPNCTDDSSPILKLTVDFQVSTGSSPGQLAGAEAEGAGVGAGRPMALS